jgi:nucleoside-diphosphate-sugar epimerase
MEAPLWIQGTVEDADRMKRVVAEHDPQVVFHLAGQTGSGRAQQEPAETFEVNIRGTWNLLEAVRICGIRPAVVLASSDAVYGTEGPRPHREEQPAHGTSPYAVSKLCAEAIGRAYAGAYGIAVSAARCSNVYGPGDHQATRLVPAAIQAILRGQPPALTAEPSAVRDFLFVEDAARGLLRLAEWAEAARPRGEAVNLCSGQAATIAEVLEAILALMGRPDLRPPQLVGATPSATEPLASAEQALRLLGWRAQVSLETGLQQTVEWYRTQDTHDTRRRAPAFR